MRKIWIVASIILLVSLMGCRALPEETVVSETIVETTVMPEEPVIEEPEPPVTTTEPIAEEPETDLQEEIFNIFLDYLDAAEKDEEYAFFSTQTKELVGSENEYLTSAKTDIYNIVKEAHLTLTDIQLKSVVRHEDRAILTITADRFVEGMQYDDEEISWKFILEDEWKIDFSYPLNILIIVHSPDPFLEHSVAADAWLPVEVEVSSFFEITEVYILINGQEVLGQAQADDAYQKTIFAEVSGSELLEGFNDIEVGARNVIGEEIFYVETFSVR